MRQKRLRRSQHHFRLVEQNATMKPHGIACILEVNILLELRMWYQITIIRARMDVKASTSANDGLGKCKAWLTMVMIRKLKIVLWLIKWLTISEWKDKRDQSLCSINKWETWRSAGGEHDVAFMIIGIDDQSQRQKYRWSSIKPTHLIPLSKIELWQQLYFHDHLSHMWACHYCNCAFRNDLGLIYLKQ